MIVLTASAWHCLQAQGQPTRDFANAVCELIQQSSSCQVDRITISGLDVYLYIFTKSWLDHM